MLVAKAGGDATEVEQVSASIAVTVLSCCGKFANNKINGAQVVQNHDINVAF